MKPRPEQGAALRDVPDATFRRLVEDVPGYAILLLDVEGRIRTWNEGAQRLTKFEAADVLGRHVAMLYPTHDVESGKPQYELRIADERGSFEESGWRLRKDGSMFWANVVLRAIRDDGGDALGFALVVRDVTDLWHASEALRESEERHRLLVQAVQDYAIYVIDPEGRILSWNEGAQRLKGYHAGEIIGANFSRFYLPEEAATGHPQENLKRALREGRMEEEGWRIRKDGTRFWANVVITPLRGPNGAHRGFVKVTRDLTARKAAEEDLRRQASENARISREFEAFAFTVAHDLRAPLRAIEHLALAAGEDLGAGRHESAKKSLDAMRASASRLSDVVDALLQFARSPTVVLERGVVDLTTLGREVYAGLVERDAARPGAFRAEDGLVATGDPKLLRIVLDNLLSNAAKYSREQPQPRIEMGRAGGAFFVRDNGVGFDARRAGETFRPFQRHHQGGRFEGMGVGLATAQRIVERHGGRLWAESAPDAGATLWFTLP